jgi:hypothetical protein
MTSFDGITWTSRISVANNSWNSVAYGNGLWVTVSHDGSGNRVMTSGFSAEIGPQGSVGPTGPQGLQGPLILQDFANDTTAAAGGISLYALYRTGDVMKMRIV